jgi:transglutaminase-like putative cysteine protease
MDPLVDHRGIRQLPAPYRAMFENDPHPKGSVDWGIWDSMVRLIPETAVELYSHFTPTQATYEAGTRPQLEYLARGPDFASASPEESVRAVVQYTSGLGPSAPVPLDEMKFGGTEEEIVARGSEWCGDVARVATALLQVVGLPARIVILEDVGRAYCGHTIVEAWRDGIWGAVDPVSNLVYRKEDGSPATTWDLINRPGLLDAQPRAGCTPSAHRGQFRWVAIANYRIGARDSVDYRIGAINQYYRTILTMSDQGWPGGLRWLFGEDHTH